MKSNGSILLAILCFMIVSFVGLALLSFTVFHEQIARARKFKMIKTEELDGQLTKYLHQMRENIFSHDMNKYKQPEIEFFNSSHFPNFENQFCLILGHFTYLAEQKNGYKKTRINNHIMVKSKTSPFSLDASVSVILLSGDIPLALIPYFVKQSPDKDKNRTQSVDFHLQKKEYSFAANDSVVLDTPGFLKEAFLMMEDEPWTWLVLRQKLNLELVNEPVEAGVYFIIRDHDIESVFVQGDVERIIFSIEDNLQKVGIIQKGIFYQIAYIPDEDYFLCWDEHVTANAAYAEKLIINGNVDSIEQEGEHGFLQQTNLILYISGRGVIRTNLISQPWAEGKLKLTNLTLLCSTSGLWPEDEGDSEIVVDSGSESIVEATIIIEGRLKNKSQQLNILGSLYCQELDNRGHISVTGHRSAAGLSPYFYLRDYHLVQKFLLDYVQEGYHEN